MGAYLGLIALGAGAVIAYQKYHKPVMDTIEKTTKQALKKVNKTLDNMM